MGAMTETPSRSWVDALFGQIERIPGPPWLLYAVLTLGCAGAAVVLRALDGSLVDGQRTPITIAFAAFTVLPWAVAHYVSRAARGALADYRPALGALESRHSELERGLTTMPAWASVVAPLLGAAVWAAGQFTAAGAWGVDANTSVATNVVTIAFGILLNAGFVIFIFRAINQTRLIALIHRESTAVDVWDTTPHRAFSRLTLAIAMSLAVPYAIVEAIAIGIGQSSVVEMVILAAALVVAVIVFALPLDGMHRQLVREKGRVIAESDRAFEIAGQKLHDTISGDLQQASALNAAYQALTAERTRLRGISTWPWSGATLRGFVTSIGLPVLLFLLTATLARILGL
jgi:hypothetical protein